MGNTYKLPLLNHRPPQPVDLGWSAEIKFDPSDATPTYIGLHTQAGASESDTGWKVYRFFYSGSDVTGVRLGYGDWTTRGGL